MERVLLFSLLIVGVTAAADVVIPTIKTPRVSNTRYILIFDKVSLECHADGNPAYQWYRNGVLVDSTLNSDNADDGRITFNSKTGDLNITQYSRRFDGRYHCVATIGSASSMSQTQTLKQIVLPRFKNTKEKTITKEAYSYLRLPCSGKIAGVGSPSDLHYHWYTGEANDELLSAAARQGGRRFIDHEGDLHFAFVTTSDADANHRGYKCGITINAAQTAFFRSPYILDITKSDPSSTKPTLQYRSEVVTGMLGSSAQLECFFSGYDSTRANNLPTIKWFHSQSVEITPTSGGNKYELLEFNHVLKVKDLREEDNKSFYCQGFTKSGNTDKHQVSLNVTSKPLWVSPLKTQTHTEESDAVFECVARSLEGEVTPDKPIWYINGVEFSSQLNHHKYVRSEDRKTLTIKNLKRPNDVMCVQCKVSNSVGYLMGDACLNVVPPIKLITVPPTEQRIEKGDLVNLTFKASYDGDDTSLTYEWIFGNVTYEKINLPSYVTHDTKTGEIFINTSKISRDLYDTLEGVYTLRVYNLYGNRVHDTLIVLTDPTPPKAITASAGFDMWIIGVIVAALFIIVVIAIIIFVICRKQQEGDYNVDKKEVAAGYDPEKELIDKGFNDLSRPLSDEYDFPLRTPRGDLEYDDVPIGADDNLSMDQYGDGEDEAEHFNEDGSFIGVYQKSNKNEDQNAKTESTI